MLFIARVRTHRRRQRGQLPGEPWWRALIQQLLPFQSLIFSDASSDQTDLESAHPIAGRIK